MTVVGRRVLRNFSDKAHAKRTANGMASSSWVTYGWQVVI